MTSRRRKGFPRLGAALAVGIFLLARPAFPSGFQVMTQGARASGMGLAFTAVADDPTAIFYNPAGMGFLSHYEASTGGSLLTRVTGDFQGANPYPGPSATEHYQKQSFLLPNVYAVMPLTHDLNFGLGIFAPYGLGLRWENPNTYSGRFISQNAVIKSADINPTFSYRVSPQIALGFGVDYRLSKVQLEKDQAAINPFTNSVADIAHVKLNTNLTSNHGWGFNAGILVKPCDMVSFGASYRSKIRINYDLDATFIQRLTGNAPFDAKVAGQIPANQKATTSIEFPSTLNFGVAVNLMGGALTLAGEADWTQWSTFQTLDINFPSTPALNLHRANLWKDSWAYRGGLQYKVTKNFAVRAGYYYDKTGQPTADAGPILSDSNRNAFTFGFGYNTESWGVDVGDVFIKFKDRDTRAGNTDNFFGVYKEAANVGSINFRLAF